MINQVEYEILKKCDDEFKWVARGKNRELWVYTKKPHKGVHSWESFGGTNPLPRRSEDLFQFIQWEDEEPYRISDLIKEYEERGDIGYTSEEYAEYLSKFNEKLLTESEEEMKKNKEWLKSWFSDGKMVYSGEYINYIIDGMDEPEKVVVPEYVAEWIAKRRDDFDLYPALKILEGNSSIWGLTYKWYRMNTHKFVNAYLTGEYKVEEELLYHALIKGHELVNDREDVYWNVDGNELYIDNNWHDYSGYKTTKLTKHDWNNLGINEDNADFVKVEEVE